MCTDTTTTSHVTDRPIEELESSAIGLDNLELIHLRSKEALAPEAAWIPEEVAGVVTTTFYIRLKLNHPDTLGITRGTVLVVRTEQIIEYITVLFRL